MDVSNQEAEALLRGGIDALRQGRAAEARRSFQTVTQTGRASVQVWLLLATACRVEGDAAAEEAAVDQVLQLEPRAIRGHVMKGDCRARADDEATALSFYESAMMMAAGQQLPNDLVADLKRIEGVLETMKSRIDARREAALVAQGFPPEARSPRFQQSLDIVAGRKRIFVQEPTGYYFPGVPQIQFYDPAEFNWAPEVEAAAAKIRTEIEALMATGTRDFRPYLQADANRPRLDENKLIDSADWSALFLCENGADRDDLIARCPTTWAAVQAAPLPRISNSPTIMFSLLRAGARIAPHTGMLNTRLICHLPLIVPPGCRFRVGNEVREWEEGKLFIFDDTTEHEAWNDSEEDRVVLIFDIWRPELSEREREEVGAFVCGPAIERGI